MARSGETLFHAKFLHRVAVEPLAPAVEMGDRVLTYGELADRSGRLAARLRGMGAGTDVTIGLSAAASPELVTAVLGVLRSGAAWLPLDPSHPADRLSYMVENSGTRLVLADDNARERIPVPRVPVAGISGAGLPDATGELTHRYVPDQLAYVIYTSGSTGVPKGVQLTQRGLRNLGNALMAAFDVRAGSRVLQFASPSFDASVFEMTMALQAGATAVIPPSPDLRFGAELAGFLRSARVTHATLPPSVLAVLPPEDLPDLEVIICAGEALPEALVDRWAPRHRLVNAYGPTEATVWASYADMAVGGGKPLIGRAVPGAHLDVVDGDLRPLPAGATGELTIGGQGPARGYVGQPGLTADRFVPDPAVPGGRRYRTGDLARRAVDGQFDFIGRIDDQVKLRGYRIEPDEIANVLRSHPDVLDVVVLIRAVAGEDRLLAYVAAPMADVAELRGFVGSRVPAYMVPIIVPVADIPLTRNGKVDRDALPMPDRVGAGQRLRRVPPRTETERRITAIVSDLLGTEPSMDDDFFSLGGHSLLAGRLAARVRAELRRELPIAAIFGTPTIEGIAAAIEGLDDGAPVLPPIVAARRDEPLPLSFPQERIWFLEQLSPGNLAYNAQAAIRLRGPLDHGILTETLTELVRRHEILRTAFVVRDGVPVQEPLAAVPVELPIAELDAALDAAERERALASLIQDTVRRPFDLAAPPLVRWLLVREAAEDHTLVQVEHHFVHDGWSFSAMLAELQAIYVAIASGTVATLAPPAVQYADFAVWQRSWMRGEVLDRHLDHWTAVLDGARFTLDLPTDRPRPRAHNFTGDALRFDLPVELSRALRASCRAAGTTLFATMFGGFAALLGRYSGQQDLVIGTGAANRRLAETENMIGMVVNTLPLRMDLSSAADFDALRHQAHAVIADGSNWQDVPLDRLVDALAPPRDPSRNPLFQTLFSFHDSAVPDLNFAGVTGSVREIHNGTAKMDLNIVVIPRAQQRIGLEHGPDDDRITLIWEYATDLFDRDTMRCMVDHYLALLADGVRHPHRELGRLRLEAGATPAIAVGERVAFPSGLLPDLVDASASAAATTPAVVDADTELSYADLVGRANHLASRLRAAGVVADQPVGVWLDRSVEMVVALLAIMKAGGAFVPLDPDLPVNRVVRVLADAGASLVCADAARTGLIAAGDRGITAVDCRPGSLSRTSAHGPEPGITGDNLVSVYYTSGSTGTPKGVASTHRGWANRMRWMQARYPLRPGETVLHKTVLSFDDAAVEIFWPLTAGATIALMPPRLHRDPRAIADYAERHDVVALHFVPSMLALFCDEITEERRAGLANLRYVISSGEALSPELVGKFSDRLGVTGARLFNQWGATEASIDSSSHECVPADRGAASVPLGEPIANNQVLLLDDRLNPVPVGVPGELYLGGTGLARGYLGDPRKTATAFVPSPYAAGERLYRTGDRGIRRRNGALTFLGRIDSQVKIRGVRIEPAEIEHTIRQFPGVGDVVVTTWEPMPGDHRLAAYVTTGGHPPGERFLAELHDYLADQLPIYMIPSSITPLDRIPVNANGKTDHRALPQPDFGPVEESARAQSDAEQLIAGIWAEVLGRQDLDIRANFFALGGHSLLATRIVARLRTALSAGIPLAVIFDNPTIQTMAIAVENILLDAIDDTDVARDLVEGRNPR